MSTHRLVGTPTSCATIDPTTASLYVAVNNPYDIRERFGERQDLQIVSLGAISDVSPDERPVVDNRPTPGNSTTSVVDVGADSGDVSSPATGLGEPFSWSAPADVTHEMVLVPAGDFIM